MIDSDIYQQRDSSLPEKLVGLKSYVCVYMCKMFLLYISTQKVLITTADRRTELRDKKTTMNKVNEILVSK